MLCNQNQEYGICKRKNILVVGATGGIGSRTAKMLAANGANVFLAGRNTEKLLVVAAELGLSNEKYFSVDISNPEMVEELKNRYFSVYPTFDILVNAAGIGIIKSIESLTGSDFLQTLNYNLYGPFLLVKTFLPAMKEL